MNTAELTGVVKKILKRDQCFLGVQACDELPKRKIQWFPAMTIVNTDPSHLPGEHWLALYITKDKNGCFFDSFGNTPDIFAPEINTFLWKNSIAVSYSKRQVQSHQAVSCGQHCVFFLYHMQKGMSFDRVLKMYTDNLLRNDAMVCKFVNNIKPVAVSHGHDFTCVQCGK